MNDRVVYRQVHEHEAGQRIENFMIRLCKGVPKRHIYKILRQVRVNKKRIRANYRLQNGDILRLPPIRTASKMAVVMPSADELRWLEQRIILETQDVMV